jgi:hypothetical protein
LTLSSFRTVCLRVLIGSLVLSAGLGLLAIAMGDFSDLFAQLLMTGLLLGAYSLVAACCAAALERGRFRRTAIAGIGLGFFALVFLLPSMWFWRWMTIDDELAEIGGLGAIWARVAGHVCLFSLPKLPDSWWWLHRGTSLLAVGVGLLLSIWPLDALGVIDVGYPESEGIARTTGAGFILLILGSAMIPIVKRWARTLQEATPADVFGTIALTCPRCKHGGEFKTGGDRCPHCGLRIRADVLPDEPE